ncbi:hypothetical protein [Clostridium estertheticum]|uniref:hypothetical protein n=1 Tax=Clostridium estertheticum TaxID=238834 RepID=UPI001CF5B2C8|nr:hypothetical protein [Clostridium estertheticum]MCB2343295.1 hypothetical protein [Clostridium estertheticum]
MNLNYFRKWRIKFLVEGNIKFTQKVVIHEVEFIQQEKDVFAIIEIESTSSEEAQNLAAEKLNTVLAAMGVLLDQHFKVDLKEVQPVIAEGIYLHGISYINSKITVNRQFPYEKIKDIEELINLSLKDNNICKIVELINKPYPKTWENLYKIYEVINHDTNIENKGWASKAKIKSFTHTANHPDACGISEARHGYIKQDPPKKPLEISEAITLIENVVTNWIEFKKKL